MKETSPKPLSLEAKAENNSPKGDQVLEGEIISEKIEKSADVSFATKYPKFGSIVLELSELFAQKKEGFVNGKLAYIASLLAAATQKKAQISLTPGEELPKTLPTHLLEAEDVFAVIEATAKEGKISEATYILATIVDVLKNTRHEADAQLFVVKLKKLAEKNTPQNPVLSNTRELERGAIPMPGGKEPVDEKASAEALLHILNSLQNPFGQVMGGLQNKENRQTPETFGAHAEQIRNWFLNTKGREALQTEYGFDFEFEDANWEAFKSGIEKATTEQEFLGLLETHLTGDASPSEVLEQLALSDSNNKYLKGLVIKAGGKKSLDELLDAGLEEDGEIVPNEVLDLSGGSASGEGFNVDIEPEIAPTEKANTLFTAAEPALASPEDLFGIKTEGEEFDLEEGNTDPKANRFERKSPEQIIKTIFNELINIKELDLETVFEDGEDTEELFNKLSDWRYQATFYYEKLLAESQKTPPTVSFEEIQKIEKLVQAIQARIARILEKFPQEYSQNQEQSFSQVTSSFLGNAEAFAQASGLEKEWHSLSEGQKAVVLRVFDQNALMYIESLSRNLHNEQLKEYDSGTWGIRHVKKLWAGVNRGKQVGKIAQEQLKSFVSDDSSAVKRQMFESALRGAPTDLEVDLARNGTPAVNFTKELQKNFARKENALLALNLNRQEKELLQNFNRAATQFALIPEEYGSSTADDRNWLTKKTNMRFFNKEFFGGFSKTEKRIYENARSEFEAARDQLARLLIEKGIEPALIEATYFSINNTVEVLQASQAMADFETAFAELEQKGTMRKAGLLNNKADFAKGMLANIGISGGSKLVTKWTLGFFGVATSPVTLGGIALSMGFAGLRGRFTGEGRAIEGLREQDVQTKYSNNVKKIALSELKLRKYQELLTDQGELTPEERADAIAKKNDTESDEEAATRRLNFIQGQINSLRQDVYDAERISRSNSNQTGVWNKVKAYTIGGDVTIKKESLTKEGVIEAGRWSEILNANLTLLDKESAALLQFKTTNENLLDESNTTQEAQDARAKLEEMATRQKTRLAKIFQQVEYVEEALAESRVTFGEETLFGEGRPQLSIDENGTLEFMGTKEYKASALNNKMALKNILRRAKTELFTQGVLSIDKNGETGDEIAETFKEVERNADLITNLVAEKARENDSQRTKYQKEQMKAAAIRGAFWVFAIGAEEAQFGIMRDAIAEAREAVGIFGYDKEHLLHEIATKAHEVATGKEVLAGVNATDGLSYEEFLKVAKAYTGHDVQIPKEVFESEAVKNVIANGDASFGTDRIALSAEAKKGFTVGSVTEEATPAKPTSIQTDTTKTAPRSDTPTAGKTAAQIAAEAKAENDSIRRAALLAQESANKNVGADSSKVAPVVPPTPTAPGTKDDSSLFSRVFRMPWENNPADTPTTQKPAVIGPNGETSAEQIKANALAQANAEKARILAESQKADSLAKVAAAKTQTTPPTNSGTQTNTTQTTPGTTQNSAPATQTTAPTAAKVGDQLPTGKVTESVTNPDKSVKVVTEAAGGAKTVTTTSADGKTVTQVNPDKSTVVTTKNNDGSATQVTKNPQGTVVKTDTIPKPKSPAEITAEADKEHKATVEKANKAAAEAAAKAKDDAAAAAKGGTQTAAPQAPQTPAVSNTSSYTLEDLPKGSLITSKAGHNGISYALWEQMKHNEAASNAIAQEHYGKDFGELNHKQQVSAMYKHLIQQGYIKLDDKGNMVEDVRVRPSGEVAYVLQEDGNIAEYRKNDAGEFVIEESRYDIAQKPGFEFEGTVGDDGKHRLEDYEYTGKGRAPRATGGNVVGTGSGRGPRVGGNTALKTNPVDILNNNTGGQPVATTQPTQTPITITNPAVANTPTAANQAPVFGTAPDTKPGVMQAALTSTHLEGGKFVAYKSDFKGGQSFTREGAITIKVPTANGGFKVGTIGYWQQVIANNPADVTNPNISEVPVHFGPLTLNGDGGFNNPEALLQRPEVRAAIEQGNIGTTIDLTKTDALTGGVAVNGNVGSGGSTGNMYPPAPYNGPRPTVIEDIAIPGLGKSHAADAGAWKELLSEREASTAWDRPWEPGGVKLRNMSAMRLFDGGIKYTKAFLDFRFSPFVGKTQAEIEQNELISSLFNGNLKPTYENGIFKAVEEVTTKTAGDWSGRFIPGTNNEVVSYIKPEDDNTAGKILYSVSKNRYFVPKEIANAAFNGDTGKVKIWLQVMETAQKAGITPDNRQQDLDRFLKIALETQERKGITR